MNKHFFKTLFNWPKPYISGTALHHILNKSPYSRYAIIKRAIHEGYLVSIRRDLYLIKNTKQSLINSFEVSLIIYGPSYISFESALSYHQWIPEAVRTTTCSTTKKSTEFDTPIGVFSYEHIPINIFPIGIEQHAHGDFTLFIAAPIKALADIIYARKRNWESLNDLYEDLRIEPENLKKSDLKLLLYLIENYPSHRVKKTLHLLLKGLNL